MPTFDGDNLVITLDAGVTSVSVEVDLYSDWKEWFKTDENSRFLEAFRTVGGDPKTATSDLGSYFFLRNDLGWRIRPPEEDITIDLDGNLVAQDSSFPMLVPTIGDFSVLITGIQPVTEVVYPEGDWTLQEKQEHLQLDSGRWRIVGNQMIFYDSDDATPLLTFNLLDGDGNPTEISPKERVPA